MRRSLLFALVVSTAAAAQPSASHRVTVVVPAVEHLAVTAAEGGLAFRAPAPGAPLADVADATARYALTVTTAGHKITGALDGAFPAGVRLAVALGAPPGARSLGRVELGAAARDLVADVSAVAVAGLPVTYTASAGATALGGGLRARRTVTYTVTDQ